MSLCGRKQWIFFLSVYYIPTFLPFCSPLPSRKTTTKSNLIIFPWMNFIFVTLVAAASAWLSIRSAVRSRDGSGNSFGGRRIRYCITRAPSFRWTPSAVCVFSWGTADDFAYENCVLSFALSRDLPFNVSASHSPSTNAGICLSLKPDSSDLTSLWSFV